MKKLKRAAGIALLVLIPTVAFAQNSKPSDSSVIKPCEKAADELRVARVEIEGLRQQIAMRDDRDKDRDRFEAEQQQIINYWKEAATARKEALSTDDRIEKIRIEQITEYKDEVARLRLENEKLRRSRTKWFAGGLILGAVAPKFP